MWRPPTVRSRPPNCALDAAADRATGAVECSAAEPQPSPGRPAGPPRQLPRHAMPGSRVRRLRVGGDVVPRCLRRALRVRSVRMGGDGSVAAHCRPAGQASVGRPGRSVSGRDDPDGILAPALSARRSSCEPGRSLLTGFVLPGDSPTSWYLTCLAATVGSGPTPDRFASRCARRSPRRSAPGGLGTGPGAPGGTVDAPLAVIEATNGDPDRRARSAV